MGEGLVEVKIQEAFISKGWTLSIAESCTGGAIAARLTRLPGCSQYFLGSLVAYSNQMKINILNVALYDLQMQGAVSEEVVVQMAQGMQKISGSDFVIAVSGIAGPDGGTLSKPVGTICASIGRLGEDPYAWTFRLEGSREEIIDQTVEAILSELYSFIA